jgi:hypothetical protein
LKLQQRLDGLHPAIATQQGGYDFQDWFYDLLDFCEIENRRPYMNAGRQIDGSLTLDGTTYLVELKFTASQADATDIDSLRSKVDDKADNTMGVMVSISGYTGIAVTKASGRKTTLLCLTLSTYTCSLPARCHSREARAARRSPRGRVAEQPVKERAQPPVRRIAVRSLVPTKAYWDPRHREGRVNELQPELFGEHPAEARR